MAKAARHEHIETIRGLACLLLVAYHAIGNDISHGMRVPDDSGWRLFTELFIHVRMPLFSFISGLVFAPDPRTLSALASAFSGKLRRLGLPLITVSSLFWVVSRLSGVDQKTPYTDVLWTNYQHYWFLQASLIITAVLLLAGFAVGGMRRAATLLILPVVVLFLLQPEADPDVFSVNQAVYLAPFFLTGLLVRSFAVESELLVRPGLRLAVIGGLGSVAVVLFILNAMVVLHLADLPFDRQSAAGLLLGLSACLALLAIRPRIAILARIGGYSYAIYLFHVFFTSAARQLAHRLVSDVPDAAVFAIALVAGVGLPIVIEKLIRSSSTASLLLLGQTARRSRPTAPGGAEAASAPRALTRDPV